MRRPGNGGFLRLIALIAIISISFVSPAFARGRRGGNSGGDLAMAAAGGAAIAAGPVLGAYIGAAAGTGTYGALLSSSAYGMAAGNIATAGMVLGGADPNTTRWVSAGASGLAGGLSSVSSANFTGQAATAEIGKSMVSSMIGAEVGYQLNDSGVPLAGAIGSVAGGFAGGFTQGALLSDGGFGQSLSDGFSQGAKYAIGSNASSIAYAAASDAISDAIVNTINERSLARPYASHVGSLGGRVAGHFAGTAMSGAPNMLDDDFYKRGGWIRNWHDKGGSYEDYVVDGGRTNDGRGYGPAREDWYNQNVKRWLVSETSGNGELAQVYKTGSEFKQFQNATYPVSGQAEGYAGQKHDFIQADGVWREYGSYAEHLTGDGNPMMSGSYLPTQQFNPAPLVNPAGNLNIN